jgi:hypothetical protein
MPVCRRSRGQEGKPSPAYPTGLRLLFGLALLASRFPSGIFASPMRRSVTLALFTSALLTLAGCKSPCRELSERLCDCVEPFQRDSCVRAAAEEESNIEPTDEELEACEDRLKTCTIKADEPDSCEFLNTPEGKQACGLAR